MTRNEYDELRELRAIELMAQAETHDAIARGALAKARDGNRLAPADALGILRAGYALPKVRREA